MYRNKLEFTLGTIYEFFVDMELYEICSLSMFGFIWSLRVCCSCFVDASTRVFVLQRNRFSSQNFVQAFNYAVAVVLAILVRKNWKG